jgi:hypothetical protein
MLGSETLSAVGKTIEGIQARAVLRTPQLDAGKWRRNYYDFTTVGFLEP